MQWPTRLGEDGQHASVLAQCLRSEVCDAVRPGDHGEVFEQERRNALAVVVVVDHEGSLGVWAVLPTFVAAPADEHVASLDHQRCAIDEVDLGEVCQLAGAQRGLRREEARVLAVW